MEPQQIHQHAHRFIECLRALEQGDDGAVEAMGRLFADGAELSNPLIEQPLRGREGIEDFWRRYCGVFRAIESTFSHVTVDDDAAGLFWHSRGRDAQDHPVDYEGVSLIELDDSGRITRFRAYFDGSPVHRRSS